MQSEKDREIYRAIDKLLTILENNFKYQYGNKIPFNEIVEIVSNIDVLLKNFEHNTDKCADIVIKRFIPLLDLITKLDTNMQNSIKYTKVLKNAYKIGARKSLEHYMVYREWDEKDKFFQPRYSILAGYIHYLQEIDTNPKFHTLIFNAPSGYGKTFPEKISEAWSFGIDDTGTILSLCSNEDVVLGGSRTVIDEIKSEHFGEVFPHLKYDESDKNFFLKETEKNWKLRNCKLVSSYYAKTTQSNVVGARASKRIHIDDLYPDYKEAMNKSLNEYYFNKSITVWEKRFVQNKIAKKVITGTLWASGDYIALMIRLMNKRYKFHRHPKYKYTWVNEDETVAIIQVPALDYETGKSTCPEIKSTSELLLEKESMETYLWQTNFQQIPTDPEALFFSYAKLRQYDKIPTTEEKACYAVIDATRKSGKDFFAMPIFKKIDNDGMSNYYFKDCLFTRTATKDMYDAIVEKIIEHHIVFLVIESNVTSELSSAIEAKLREKGVGFCIIVEKYNTIPKATRIETEKGIIKKQMIFPKQGTYGINTEIGMFMDNLTLYNSSGSNANDDAPDACALFASEVIEENSQVQQAEPLSGIREFF